MSRWLPFCALLLTACALTPPQGARGQPGPADTPQAARVHLDLVRGMMDKQQYYAALAHLEELDRQDLVAADELQLLRGQCLYRLDRLEPAAAALRPLIEGRYAGEALHGLGLIHVRWDLAAAVRYFNAAMQLRPTDPELRNDLGYALMMAGRLAEARHHLATAAELDPQALNASNNLILSYLVDNRDATAEQLARELELEAGELTELRREASLLRRVIRDRSAEFSRGAGRASR